MYGVGIILGAGIYVLVGSAAATAGNSVWISFLLGMAVSALSGLSYAELASMYPRAAAEYVFVKNAFRNNFLASTIGWLTVFVSIIAAATVALGFGGYLTEFVNIPIIVSATLLIVGLSIINFLGIRESSTLNIIFTLVEVAGLGIVIYLGFFSGHLQHVNYLEMPFGIQGVFSGFVLIFFAFIGFEDIVNISEETKNPRRIIPKAIFFSVLITGILYILVSLASIQIMPWNDLGKSVAPLADVTGKVLGVNGTALLSAIALFATTNTVLIILLSGSRMLYGLSSHGSLHSMFSKIHFKTKTPLAAIVTIMVASILFVTIGNIITVANITVFLLVIVYSMVNLSVIVLRLREPNVERPFKVPFSIRNYPILSIIGLGSTLFMLTQFGLYVMLLGIFMIGIAALLFVLIGNKIKN
jgi:APA family basic amino acid/polyamine antiporter